MSVLIPIDGAALAANLPEPRRQIPTPQGRATPAPGHKPEPYAQLPRRLLLAEASRETRLRLAKPLRQAGFGCELASDAADALTWALAAPFDVMVMDLSLPLDGLKLLAHLREYSALRGTKLIATGSEAEIAEKTRVLFPPPDAVLREPLEADAIVREVQRLTSSLKETSVRVAAQDPDATIADLTGEFESMRPSILCKALHASRQSGRLELAPQGSQERGVIRLRAGEILAAQLFEPDGTVVTGEIALRRIFEWPKGTFRLDMETGASSTASLTLRNITRPTPRVIEEASGGGEHAVTRVGPFELLETLSEGTQEKVYRARRIEGPNAGRVVRLVIDSRPRAEPEKLARIEKLVIPGIARFFGHGQLPDGTLWYESEPAVGPTLGEVVRERGPLTRDRALQVFEDVLEALAQAHAQGVPHGGLDARRIVIPPGGLPVLLDYGLAAGDGPGDHVSACTTSPEVWQGHAPEARSDLYAVGVLMYLAFTATYPFEDKNPIALRRYHVSTPAPTLAEAGLSQAGLKLETLLMNLLAKDPTARCPDARAAAKALAEIQLELEAAKTRSDDVNLRETHDTGEIPPPAGYSFVRWLGEGAAGEVFEGRHTALEKAVAIKAIRVGKTAPPELRKRFLRESRIAAALTHPGIVHVVDAREEGSYLYIIMEYVNGESVMARLRREGSLEEKEALSICRQVLAALAAAHEHGIVHRDVKPDNILLTADGTAKIADFGLARSIGTARDEITRTGIVSGTPFYMSPEQCLGEAADARSDLYALGATLYHMLSGRPPFLGGSIIAVVHAHVEMAPPPLETVAPRISRETCALVARLLAKSPLARYQTAQEVLADLPGGPPTAEKTPVVTNDRTG